MDTLRKIDPFFTLQSSVIYHSNYHMQTTSQTSNMPTFSCYIPRIDTRSLPDMQLYPNREDYIKAVKDTISTNFIRDHGSCPSEVRLAQKHTHDGYLFFVGFIHFECEPVAHRAKAFRCAVAEGETTLTLPEGAYWKVKKYRATTRTLDQQHRLFPLKPTVAPPPVILKRQNTPAPPLARPTLKRQSACQLEAAKLFRDHDASQLALSASEVLGTSPVPSPEFPPIGFAAWLENQSKEVREGYASAMAHAQHSITRQYHMQSQIAIDSTQD